MNLTVYPVNWFRIIVDLERAGLSDTEIAKRIGCHKGNISKYKGGTEPLHTTGERLRHLHHIHCLSVQAPKRVVPSLAATSS